MRLRTAAMDKVLDKIIYFPSCILPNGLYSTKTVSFFSSSSLSLLKRKKERKRKRKKGKSSNTVFELFSNLHFHHFIIINIIACTSTCTCAMIFFLFPSFLLLLFLHREVRCVCNWNYFPSQLLSWAEATQPKATQRNAT